MGDTNVYRASGYDEIGDGSKPPGSTRGESIGQKVASHIRKNLLVVCLVVCMALGLVVGSCLRLKEPPLSFRQQMYLRFPGEIFMNVLQLLILPLIVSSLITGLTALDSRVSGRLGARAILYYLTTTLLAVILGIVLVLTIRPGQRGGTPETAYVDIRKLEPVDTFLDLIRQMFPTNLVEACFTKKLTHLEEYERNLTEQEINSTLFGNATTAKEYRPVLQYTHGINMLGLVTFSVAFGVAINKLGAKGRPLKEFMESLCEATMVLVSAAIWFSPIGVFSLVAAQVVKMDDLERMFAQLGLYSVTVVSGLVIHGFVVLPLLYLVLVGKNPYRFILGMLQALLTAVGTSSSSATLPVTMKNLEENNRVDPRITSFVAPVGATVNMDGTALYEAVAAIFIGQVRGFDLDVGSVITICLTATAAAVGAAGVPQAGLVTMVVVLTSVGLPTDGLGMILAVDWLLDRLRTAINVLGDAFGAGIVHHFSLADLERMSEADQEKMATDKELQVIGDSGIVFTKKDYRDSE